MSYYFPRGKGPLCSFLMCTRNRSVMAAESIDSIYSLAKDKKSFEFVLKVDNDDIATINLVVKLIGMGLPIRTIISPRDLGYAQMHVWVKQMASMATGDWQLCFNDDARMTQQGWDEILLYTIIPDGIKWHGCRDICSVLCQTIGRPDAHEFMFVRSKVIEILGGWGINVHCDNWVNSVVGFLGSSFMHSIQIKHLSDDTNDQVRKEALSVYPVSGKLLNSAEQLAVKSNDIKKLLDYIENWKKQSKATENQNKFEITI